MKLKEKEITLENGLKMLDSLINRTPSFGKNEVIGLKDGYVSYNPNTDTGKETALVKNKKFFILLGDYRKNVKGLKTTQEVIKVFKDLIKKGAKVSLWSNYDYK